MSVLIPRLRISSAAMRQLLFSGEQEGTLGGPSLPIPRMGDRFAIDLETAQLRQDAAGRDLIAALTQAATEDAIILIAQPNIANLGSGTVNGSGQGGTSLNVAGIGPAGTVIPRGYYFSIVHGGRRYVHITAAAAASNGAGVAAVPIWPMLRFLTVNGDAVEFGDAKIEGKLTGFERGAKWIRNRVDPLALTITERA